MSWLVKKMTCCECGKKRECKPVILHVNGDIDNVCRQCWKRLNYEACLPKGGLSPIGY